MSVGSIFYLTIHEKKMNRNEKQQISNFIYTNNRTTEKCYGWNKKGRTKMKNKNFEFVEVENMIKVHDEINFFQYFF